MKLCDWYEFNFNNDQFKCEISYIYVKIFRKESYDKDGIILEQMMDPIDMVHLFGDFEMFMLNRCIKNDYATICVYIYKKVD